MGATLAGISADPPPSHRSFILLLKWPFTLLSDLGGTAFNAFALHRSMGLKQRSTSALRSMRSI
ncbi:MAG: redoxin domain-containing protein [Flavobacteriales bacterium]|nr:redoxin domain-containing protein [Flavobacteriales bacterium]MBP9080995.1 redoxin domain-containing protein [Flavobacteriales bacterium]